MIPVPTPTFQNKQDGSIFIDGNRDGIMGGILVPQSTDYPLIVPARSGTNFGLLGPTVMDSPADAYLEILSLFSSALAGGATVGPYLFCSVTDFLDGQRRLSKRPVPLWHIFGNVQKPFKLLDPERSEPLLLRPQQSLQFQFFNALDTISPSFRIYAHHRRFQMPKVSREIAMALEGLARRRKNAYPYWIVPRSNIDSCALPGITVGANATVDFFFEEEEETVIITRLLLHTGAAANIEIELWDAGSEKQFFNQKISNGIFSTTTAMPAESPFEISLPPTQKTASQVRGRIKNLDGASVDVFISLFGVRTK